MEQKFRRISVISISIAVLLSVGLMPSIAVATSSQVVSSTAEIVNIDEITHAHKLLEPWMASVTIEDHVKNIPTAIVAPWYFYDEIKGDDIRLIFTPDENFSWSVNTIQIIHETWTDESRKELSPAVVRVNASGWLPANQQLDFIMPDGTIVPFVENRFESMFTANFIFDFDALGGDNSFSDMFIRFTIEEESFFVEIDPGLVVDFRPNIDNFNLLSEVQRSNAIFAKARISKHPELSSHISQNSSPWWTQVDGKWEPTEALLGFSREYQQMFDNKVFDW